MMKRHTEMSFEIDEKADVEETCEEYFHIT